MGSFLNLHPRTWYEAKWPYPSPKLIRENADLVDKDGRKYCKVSDKDVNVMKLRSSKTWWWVALKNSAQMPLQLRSRITLSDNTKCVVSHVALQFFPRRCVGIVSFS